MTASPLPPLDPDLFGEGPARDARFTVAERWVDCVNLPDGTPEWRMEFFHRQMNEEVNVLENAARNLAEFPDVEWPLRMWLARQCADEARHVQAYRRVFEARGGRIGMNPVLNFQYKVLGRIPHLIGRLAVQNRTFEADGLDAATFALDEARRMGDADLTAMYEAQQADEVQHVRFANEWIRRQVAESPRNVLRMAAALTRGTQAFLQVFAGGGTHATKYTVAEDERIEAGFDRDEVKVAVDLSNARIARARQEQDGR